MFIPNVAPSDNRSGTSYASRTVPLPLMSRCRRGSATTSKMRAGGAAIVRSTVSTHRLIGRPYPLPGLGCGQRRTQDRDRTQHGGLRSEPMPSRRKVDEVVDLVDRRSTPRDTLVSTERAGTDAAVERVLARLGDVEGFTETQVREIARIALVAMIVDDPDRQRRDEAARENRRRLRRLGRD